MTEVDPIEFFNRVTDTDEQTKEYTIVDESNAELTVELTVVNRKVLLEQISRFPDELLEMFSEVDDEVDEEAIENGEVDPEDVDVDNEATMLSAIDGEAIDAFEQICIESIEHEKWTRHNVEQVVSELSFEVLFEIGSKVIEHSLESQGSIKDFHEADSVRNS